MYRNSGCRAPDRIVTDRANLAVGEFLLRDLGEGLGGDAVVVATRSVDGRENPWSATAFVYSDKAEHFNGCRREDVGAMASLFKTNYCGVLLG